MEENNEIQLHQPDEQIAAVRDIEIDTQIATAKQYPRDLKSVREMILLTATQDKATAEECFYSLPRKQRQADGSYKDVEIQGESIRFAEIVLAFWGNIQTGTRTLEINKLMKTITVQAVVWDLERNVKTSEEVTKNIATSKGQIYSDDMIIMTIKSASSQALRNAIFRAVPKVMFKSIMDEIKKKAVEGETGSQLVASVTKAIGWFVKQGVPKDKILAFFGNKKVEEFTQDDLVKLKGIYNGIESGEFKIADAFAQTESEVKAEAVVSSIEEKMNPKEKKEKVPTTYPDKGKRKPADLEKIEKLVASITEQDLADLGLSSYMGPKDIAMNAESTEIEEIVDYLTNKS